MIIKFLNRNHQRSRDGMKIISFLPLEIPLHGPAKCILSSVSGDP